MIAIVGAYQLVLAIWIIDSLVFPIFALTGEGGLLLALLLIQIACSAGLIAGWIIHREAGLWRH